MKFFTFSLVFLLSTVCLGQLSEGYLQYNIDVEAIDTSLQAKQSVGMLRNSKMEIYFDANHFRVDFKMGQISETTMILDFKKDSALSLAKTVFGSFASLTTLDDLEYAKKDSSSSIQLFDETRKILGYNCKKAVVSSKGVKTTYWYTEEIVINTQGNEFFSSELPGFPLFFSKVENGIYMEYQASNIRNTVENPNLVFSLKIPPGYKQMPKKR